MIRAKICFFALVASLVVAASGQGGLPSQVPGGSTIARMMAASTDGVSRYFARDGPIQPAIAAIGGLPMRAAELTNRGISRMSDAMASGAQRMSRSAGDSGNSRMPGMAYIERNAPAPISRMTSMMQQGVRTKNQYIMGQAEAGIQSGNRIQNMMRGGRGNAN